MRGTKNRTRQLAVRLRAEPYPEEVSGARTSQARGEQCNAERGVPGGLRSDDSSSHAHHGRSKNAHAGEIIATRVPLRIAGGGRESAAAVPRRRKRVEMQQKLIAR